MKKILICFLLGLSALADSSCSYLTSRGRQEAAYARYVRRSSAGRVKMQQNLSRFPRVPPSQPLNEPQMTAETGPESLTISNESQ
jgi:hypothetical protein